MNSKIDIIGAFTLDSAPSVINNYCEKLSGSKPSFSFMPVLGGYECTVIFPPNSAFQTITGPVGEDISLARYLACFEACKKLHQIALNNHLVPFMEDPSENDDDDTMKDKELSWGAGTTKRKELHGKVNIRALCGTWGDKFNGARFHAYKFEFSSNIVTEKMYSGFVLLTESKLDDDVGNIELDLYLMASIVKASISSYGQVYLDTEQVMKAKCFHELIFNGLFGRLVSQSQSKGGGREFLLQNDTNSMWSPDHSYFLLPLVKLNYISEGSMQINWHGINSCGAAIETLRRRFSSVTRDLDDNITTKTSPHDSRSSKMECVGTNKVHFANCVVDANEIKHMAVLAIHTGKIYCIIEINNDLSAESPFDGNNERSNEYTTFSEYFSQRYGITLKNPALPLLRLKQSHNPHNLLNFHEEDRRDKIKQIGLAATSKMPAHVNMPPELLCVLDVKRDVLNSLYLLPSLMYRIESLMLASQIREEINKGQHFKFNIRCSLILEALTTMRCSEKISMERHELLGDSVLKFVASCHLFLKYPKKDEGELTTIRTSIVRNSTLYKLGTDRKLQGYIRDSAFDPRLWVAPGHRSIHPVNCDCGLETLEVPLDVKFHTEDPNVVVGKFCDKGHRWMCSKTIADCAEALIGAYFVGGGLFASLNVMQWLGLGTELNLPMVEEAITAASLHTCMPNQRENIAILENKIGYQFSVKGLLLEAITHLSAKEHGIGCYERLEFLGDAVLDLLITCHLYHSHTKTDPGMLSDLRSASVNNANFAHVSVRRNLHEHLQHSSRLLESKISEYVKLIYESDPRSLPSIRAPKALGDLVESIAGAILIDTKLNLEQVWKVFYPLLFPIVTPDNLELPPYRELNELCNSLGYFVKVKENYKKKGSTSLHAEISVQLPNVLLVREGMGANKKTAKGEAALLLLKELEKWGISRGKGKKHNPNHMISYSSSPHKRPRLDETNLTPLKDSSKNIITVKLSNNLKKGEPRTILHEVCKKLHWPMPAYITEEGSQIEYLQGSKGHNNCYVSKITLCIPNLGSVEGKGDAKSDKKSSLDSAALQMILELDNLREIEIDPPPTC